MAKLRIKDDNTKRWWTPVTGGANVPALNALLAPFNVGFGQGALGGRFQWPVSQPLEHSAQSPCFIPASSCLLARFARL